MLQFFIAFIVVFAIGMGIRYLIKSGKSKNQAPPPAAPPPPMTQGTCPQCGKPVQPGAGFCDACGAKLR